MSYETCENCGESGETDDDGGVWDGKRYMCAACVKLMKEGEDPPGDPYEEMLIRERRK